MKKFAKKFKVLGLAVLVATGTLALAGCSNEQFEAKNNLNVTMKDKLNQQMDKNSPLSFEVDRYEFLGADFSLEGNVYSVELSGLARNQEKTQNAYINATVNVEKAKVDKIGKKDKLSSMLNFLNEIVKEYEFEYIDFVSVTNAKELSTRLTKEIESPVEEFVNDGGMLYAVSKPIINKEEGFAVFQAKSYVNYSRKVTHVTYGVVGYSDNKPKYGLITTTKVYREKFIQTSNVYVRASAQELEEMEKNPSLVFDKFVSYAKNKDKENIVIQSVEVQKAKEFNTDMHYNSSLEINK